MVRRTCFEGLRGVMLAGTVSLAACSAARGGASDADAATTVDVAQPDAPGADASPDQGAELDARVGDASTGDAPTTDAPAVDAPVADVVTRDALAIDVSALDAPLGDVVVTDVSTLDARPADAPTDTPATDVLALDAPAVDASTTDVSTLDAPAGDAPPVPCPSSAAGDGLSCADVGEGCAGGIGCGGSYACTCNSAHRWQCVAMPSTCDAGRDAATSTDVATACSVVGDYALDLVALGTVYLRLRADGFWRNAPSFAELDATTAGGDYTATSTELSLRETSASLAGCTSSQVGVYRYSFEGACATLRLTRVSDPCSIRGIALDGAALLRR